MPDEGMTMRSNDTRDLVGVVDADDRKLYRGVHSGEEVGDLGPGRSSVNLNARVLSNPALHPSIQLVAGHSTGTRLQDADREDRRVA